MDVYVILDQLTLGELRTRVRQLEELGVAGVLVPDHLFFSNGRAHAEADRPPEPLTMLAAVAALSDRLSVGTIVSNIGLLHPVLVLRQFAQLAAWIGGERVLAGLGAGWNREEFEALGMAMPGHRTRMDRLEQAAALARALFDEGIASVDGSQVQAHDLPLSPLPAVPPRLLLGGGSDRLLDIAGRYADVLDLNGSSRSTPVVGPSADLRTADMRRELSTTVEHLEESVRRVRAAALQAGRPPLMLTHMLNYVTFCRDREVEAAARAYTTPAGLDARPLEDCPYVLLGEPARMREALRERRQRLGVRAVLAGLGQDFTTIERLCREVIPYVD